MLTKINVNKTAPKKTDDEYEVCKKISKYLIENYPHVVFQFDFASGTRLTPGQATRMKELNPRRGYPDLFIAKTKMVLVDFYSTDSTKIVEYSGLFIEVKKDGEKLFRKDNSTPRTPHIAEQMAMATVLRANGYQAEFGIGFENCKEIIDNYLK